MNESTLTPENLIEHNYSIHYHLQHDALMPFIKEYLMKKNFVTIFYWSFNILLIVYIIYVFTQENNLEQAFSKFSIGIVVFFLLIPLHEFIHGMGYKLAGAKDVTYKAIWKKLVFYAMADRFVTKKIPFVFLAIAPFIIINSILGLCFFLFPSPYHLLSLGALFIHTSGCSGDFAMISYFYMYWDQDPVTYDHIAGKESFFFVKKR